MKSRETELHPICDELRVLSVGDYWEYSVEGYVDRDDQRTLLQGSSTVTVEQRITNHGTFNALVFCRLLNLNGIEGPEGDLSPPPGLFYITQNDETLEMYILGDRMGADGVDRFAAEAQVFFPGRWTAETSYENTLDFGHSGSVTNTLKVTEVVEVETVLGRYCAWKAPITSQSDQFGTVAGCDYWTPQLGAPIQFDMVMPGPRGSTMTTVSKMRTYRLQG
jgi:hypothetical protein